MECNRELEIERLRAQLLKVAEYEGLHSDRTVSLSRELDLLINEYEKYKAENGLKEIL
ncbi:aspartyl-phosphate phosphatase Spo0E family protein [Sporosarcina sp.]|uniref:aspartyl-phosphate phosphatase Spo0E family protein n=1 Tax=Sporosarcina sp. TaxID=49982 RepID=UPI002634B2C7|nr:aspartyl-phosphate phosphatase Spo0E family protein [Sporosarcina sp.]